MTDKDTAEQAAEPDFESSLKELETLVEKLEQGDLSLEESLRSFERGIELTRTCQRALRGAEQKVETLVERDSGDDETAPFDDERQY